MPIQFPKGATHAKQEASDGRVIIVNQAGTRFLIESAPMKFGTYVEGRFVDYVPEAAPAPRVVTIPPPAAPAAPVVRPAAPNIAPATKTAFIENLILTTQLTAQEIGAAVVAQYGGELSAALKTISAVPTKMRARGVACRTLSNRAPRINLATTGAGSSVTREPETTASNA